MPDGDGFRLTRHAVKRMRQRLGLNKGAAERELRRALEQGMTVEECVGGLRRWLDYLGHRHGEDTHYRVTPVAVYCFHGKRLVTVIKMEPQYRNSATSQWKRLHGRD